MLNAPHPALEDAGLEPGEGLVLSALWEADGASEDSLARRARVPGDAVARLVEGLGLLGYVEREAEGVWLTGDGFRLRAQAAVRSHGWRPS